MTAKTDKEDAEGMPFISRRALQQPFLISCHNCFMGFRTENLTPYTMYKRNWFCPACGSSDVEIKSNYEDDRWYAIAESFGLPLRVKSAQFIKQLYEVWDVTEYEHFKDFVIFVLSEAKK